MGNKPLKRVKALLTEYFCYFKHNDVLVIAEDKSVMPFAFLTTDSLQYPGKLLLSLALDYTVNDRVAQIALIADKVLPVLLSDSFYVSKMGITHIGEEAEKYYDIDKFLPLEDMEPESKTLH